MELKDLLPDGWASVSLPSAAELEQRAAALRRSPKAEMPLTVLPETPADRADTGLKGLFRRAVYKSIRVFTEPPITRQNRVNRQLAEEVAELRAQVAELERRLNEKDRDP